MPTVELLEAEDADEIDDDDKDETLDAELAPEIDDTSLIEILLVLLADDSVLELTDETLDAVEIELAVETLLSVLTEEPEDGETLLWLDGDETLVAELCDDGDWLLAVLSEVALDGLLTLDGVDGELAVETLLAVDAEEALTELAVDTLVADDCEDGETLDAVLKELAVETEDAVEIDVRLLAVEMLDCVDAELCVDAPVTVTVSVPSAVAETASVARTTMVHTCPSASSVLSATVTSPVEALIW